MKYILIVIFLFSLNFSNAQSKSFINFIGRTISLELNMPSPNVVDDSCYYSRTLLKLEIDKEFKVTSIVFSDNAERWLIDELSNRKEKIDIKKMEKYAKEEGVGNISIVIPFIIRSVTFPCDKKIPYNLLFDNKYFQFNGRNLQGNISFADPMEYSFNKPNY